jgi:drug/metabolite transporter (DMT)-like permease
VRTLRDRRTLAAFVAIVLLAGLNGVAVRFSNHELAPLWGASLRFVIASGVLFVLVAVSRSPLPRGRALVGSLLYGLLAFAATFGLLYWALVEAGAGIGQIILALVPLLTFLFAVAQGLERFRWQGLVGALVAIGGIAYIFADQVKAAVPAASIVAIVAAAVCMAESNVVIKWFPRANPIATNAVAMGVGAISLLLATLAAGERTGLPGQPVTWLAVGYVSVFGSVVVFTLFLYVIARWSASASSYVMLLIPLVTVAAGATLDSESISLAYVVGGPLVLLGVYVGAFGPSLARFVSRAAGPAARAEPAAELVFARGTNADGGEPGIGNPGCA